VIGTKTNSQLKVGASYPPTATLHVLDCTMRGALA
jgi:hypothetical protein